MYSGTGQTPTATPRWKYSMHYKDVKVEYPLIPFELAAKDF